MKDHFDILNLCFDAFSGDAELTGLLGTDVGNMEACDTVMRRSFADVTTIDPSELPFIDFSYVNSNGATNNYLVNREPLEVNVYATNIHEASVIYKEVARLVKGAISDAQLMGGYQRSLPISGIYCWSSRYKTMVSS